MRGEGLGFGPDTNTGAIAGHDGRRRKFVRLEWSGALNEPGYPAAVTASQPVSRTGRLGFLMASVPPKLCRDIRAGRRR